MYEKLVVGDHRQQVLADLRQRVAGLSAGTVGAPLRPIAPAAPMYVPWEPLTAELPPGADVPSSSVLEGHRHGALGFGILRDEGPDSGVLAVPGPLARVLPRGGLPRGGVVSLTGESGMTSLLFGLLAGPEQLWSALVGMPGLGLLAAVELGVDLERVVLIPDPGPDVVQILSILADGVDLIAVAAPAGPLAPPSRLRVLTARLRQRGAVLLVAGQWPGADLALSTRMVNWSGLGQGHGRLRDRDLLIRVAGRGAAGHYRDAVVRLRGTRSGVELLPDQSPAQPLVAEVG